MKPISKLILLGALTLAAQGAFAGGGGGGVGMRGEGISYQVDPQAKIDFIVLSVISSDNKGNLIIQARDAQGKAVVLRVKTTDIVPMGNGTYGVNIQTQDI